MLDRNRRIKNSPERFQQCTEQFDVIITCEERVYDQVIDFLESRSNQQNVPVHIINVEIPDNHEEAVAGAFIIADLVSMLSQASDLDNEIDDIMNLIESHQDSSHSFMHSIAFY